jgi:hypothetical protein
MQLITSRAVNMNSIDFLMILFFIRACPIFRRISVAQFFSGFREINLFLIIRWVFYCWFIVKLNATGQKK